MLKEPVWPPPGKASQELQGSGVFLCMVGRLQGGKGEAGDVALLPS